MAGRISSWGIATTTSATRLPAYIYWGGAAGFSAARRRELPTDGIAGFAAADLNRDGFPDLVCANELGEASFVYWGAPGGPVAGDRSDYVTATAKGVAVADFNRDGWLDLAFANGSDRAGGSFIYWGGEHGLKGPATLPTRQAVGVTAADLDDDGVSRGGVRQLRRRRGRVGVRLRLSWRGVRVFCLATHAAAHSGSNRRHRRRLRR